MTWHRICVYCGTRYEVPEDALVHEYRTADPLPPAGVTIVVAGVTVHQCSNGVGMETLTDA